ncbi:adenylosuccinate lyase [Candidatus Peregrinibacteria bacterium]|nr:adenylosuccinate lyase [Candidatus Peregrinibacteria bacterium]
MTENLLSISAIDGRYAQKVEFLSKYFSEAALMRYRVVIEIEWFIFLFNEVKLPNTKVLDAKELRLLRALYESFDVKDAAKIKEIEKITNHDVKAVEYFIKNSLAKTSFVKYLEFFHFACTSEDVHNFAYSCMIRDFIENEGLVILNSFVKKLYTMAVAYKSVPMMSRTHGQPATPTTLGKELINFVARLDGEIGVLEKICLSAKMNGAVGNYNAHVAAYPEVDWISASEKFVNDLGFDFNMHTTQIESHDSLCRIFDSVKRANNIVLDLDRDMCTYISLGYFGQKIVKGEVGSSTIPHKVNPIDFENSEGNLGVANALFEHFSAKLPISRMQRDLSDSTVLRNAGSAFAHSVLAYNSTMKGLDKCEINRDVISSDLKDRWELLAEPIQVVMKKNTIKDSYEKLKDLTRGKGNITKAKLQSFIQSLKIKEKDKKYLLSLTPEKYIGLAKELVDAYKLIEDEGCSSGSCGGCG